MEVHLFQRYSLSNSLSLALLVVATALLGCQAKMMEDSSALDGSDSSNTFDAVKRVGSAAPKYYHLEMYWGGGGNIDMRYNMSLSSSANEYLVKAIHTEKAQGDIINMSNSQVLQISTTTKGLRDGARLLVNSNATLRLSGSMRIIGSSISYPINIDLTNVVKNLANDADGKVRVYRTQAFGNAVDITISR